MLQCITDESEELVIVRIYREDRNDTIHLLVIKRVLQRKASKFLGKLILSQNLKGRSNRFKKTVGNSLGL